MDVLINAVKALVKNSESLSNGQYEVHAAAAFAKAEQRNLLRDWEEYLAKYPFGTVAQNVRAKVDGRKIGAYCISRTQEQRLVGRRVAA